MFKPNAGNAPPIQDAASVILTRGRGTDLQVYLTKRAETMKFAPGFLVFPGGKVDQVDRRRAYWRRRAVGTQLACDFAFRVAALRELYEEVGVYSAGRGRWRVTESRRKFQPETIDLNVLGFFGQWLTPQGMPQRFNTRFYTLNLPQSLEPKTDDKEAVFGAWYRPKDILGTNTAPKFMPPTRFSLIKLAFLAAGGALERNFSKSLLETTEPQLVKKDGRAFIDAGQRWRHLEQLWKAQKLDAQTPPRQVKAAELA